MKERPILFSAPMVRAVLDGSKGQTRRICKAAKDHDDGEEYRDADGWPLRDCSVDGAGDVRIASPYGVPGDRLWVRESFSGPHHQERHPPRDWHSTDPIHYWADGNPARGDWTKPRPGMFMPRWASRLTLEVKEVRVERLKAISRGDAMDEGCPFPNMAQGPDPRQWYAELWESINGAGSWAANPWVWVVEFRRASA